jgi:uncharacterized protein (DUF2141 family)
MKKLISIAVPSLLLIFCRCAQVVSLSGGQPDRAAPVLLTASPPLSANSFSSETIVLEFDEYIQLLDPTNEVLISPLLAEFPEMIVQGKKLLIRLKKENLKPNTTYRIAFGNAIGDMNERNLLKNFEYIFSTGLTIDTLRVKGQITQAEDNTAAIDMLACLYNYQSGYDSLPYKELPLYICKADRHGDFEFTNLPKGKYELMVIGDKNHNLLYDIEKESIGFSGQALQLAADTMLTLKAFKESPAKTFIVKSFSPDYGSAFVILNQRSSWSIKALNLNQTKDILLPKLNAKTDSLKIYYRNIKDTLALVSISESGQVDTLYIRVPPYRKNSLSAAQIRLPELPPTIKDKAVLQFNRWMDTNTVVLPALRLLNRVDSSVKIMAVTGHWQSVDKFEIHNPLSAATNYTLEADSGAFADQMRTRSVAFNLVYKTKSVLDFGKLKLKIKFKTKQSYLVEVLNERQQIVESRQIALALSASNATTLEFSMLPPGTFQVRIVYDDNQNGKWDSGNLLKRIQAEKISIMPKQVKVIPDWELEEEIIEK